jgi:DNA polymerase III epsilon subunit-like protein
MRILYLDLESTPILGYVWRAYEDSLLDIKKDYGLLCFAYAWGDEPVTIVSLRSNTERQVVKKLWELFNEADVIVAHNGDKFDIKMSNALFIRYNLKPPSPYKTVDTLKLARRYFKFTKNNLDFLSMSLLGEGKHATDKSLWFKCMAGDVEAFKQMELYCSNDVSLLRRLHHKIKSWHTGNPNSNLYQGTSHACSACGKRTQKRGFMYTRVGKYQRHQCTTCGHWDKGEKIKTDKVIS